MSAVGPGKTLYAKSDDLSLAYQVVGEGPPDLLYIPGFVSHIEMKWEIPALARYFNRLASFTRLILFDRRGQGLSDRPSSATTLEETMDDALAVMEAAGSKRAAVFGESEGGTAAALLAATYPERIHSLILWGAYARVVRGPDNPDGIPVDVLDRFLERIDSDWGGPFAIRTFAPSVADDPRWRDAWASYLRRGTSPSGAKALIGLYRDIDARHVLGSISVPTLVAHSRRDRVVPIALARYMADRIPDARMLEIDSDDHLAVLVADELVPAVEELLTGRRSERESERALATVLFTDIVASTARASQLGDSRWRELLERHDQLAREELDLHRGREIKQTGDGFLATFDGPARAIRCAQRIEDRVRELGIEVRAGLHTGEVEVRNSDVGGVAVHLAARVCGTAGPGEVLVSSTVRDLVFGSGIEFEDRGARELKGVPGEWRLFAAA